MFIVCKRIKINNSEVDVLGDELPIGAHVIVTLRNRQTRLPAHLDRYQGIVIRVQAIGPQGVRARQLSTDYKLVVGDLDCVGN